MWHIELDYWSAICHARGKKKEYYTADIYCASRSFG